MKIDSVFFSSSSSRGTQYLFHLNKFRQTRFYTVAVDRQIGNNKIAPKLGTNHIHSIFTVQQQQQHFLRQVNYQRMDINHRVITATHAHTKSTTM